jgi:hypothetical protein
MGDIRELANLGDLTKPASVLIEKVSEAVGGLAAPWQIRRVAQAEADAEAIKALTRVRTDLTLRALDRFIKEEAKKQQNMESITKLALHHLEPDSAPEKMEDDWIVDFFDKCRLISDAEMQHLWAKVLAGEANVPGRYSKRTVNCLSSLDKTDAQLFSNLCSFGWLIGDVVTLIFNEQDAIYNSHGLSFNDLKHLDEIGLISYDVLGYSRRGFPKKFTVRYFEEPFELEFPKPENNALDLGRVLLSKVSQELAPICGSQPISGFKEHVTQRWTAAGVKVTQVETIKSVDLQMLIEQNDSIS